MNKFFNKLSDQISYVITTWHNFLFWVIAVLIWFILGPLIAHAHFLPAWFTSNAFNFPLNTVTTLAELYIGFLVGRNTNRTSDQLTEHIDNMKGEIDHMQNDLDTIIDYVKTNKP